MSGHTLSSSSASSRLPRPTPTSRSSTPTSSSKRPTASSSSSKPSRSKSNLPPPRILPFPDLPIRSARGSRDSSRAGSPLSTPGFDRLEVTFDQMVMMARGGSPDGGAAAGGNNGHVSSGSGTNTPLSGPSLLNVSSPLAISSLSRTRAATAPSEGAPTPSPTGAPSSNRMIPTPSPMRSTTVPRPESPPTPAGLSTSAPPVAIVAPNPLAPPLPAVLAPSTDYLPPSTPARSTHNVSHGHSHSHAATHLPAPMAPPLTTPVIPPPSLQPLSDHLYQAFLKGICPDVRLVIKKWGVSYHVHRMVLSQASFFNSLFLGGFSETISSPRRKQKGSHRARDEVSSDDEWNGEEIELRFDDSNITRAAFEVCLSRLYSSHPHLHFPTILLSTAAHPLTPAFPTMASDPDLRSFESSLPHHTVLATPRLLLSLLATTIYIGHSSLLREVFAMILRTVGPMTVGKYLAFAVGDGIGEEEWVGQTAEGAKSLSGVARRLRGEEPLSIRGIEDEEDMVEDVLRPVNHTPRSSTDSDVQVKDEDHKVSETSDTPTRFHRNTIPSLHFPSRSNSMRSGRDEDPFSFGSTDANLLPHFYGVVGNKIGEACVCWLARWGFDVLNVELEAPDSPYRIWSHRGLPAKFVRALLSSDHFFVKDEMQRYTVARKVLELRRRGWEDEMDSSGDLSLSAPDEADHGWEEWEEEEREIQKVFADGIHYCHMTFEDLSTIASDIDPQTSLPYAPLSVLQAAHWAAADLRARVTAHERSGTSEEDAELGLTHTTSVITSSSNRRRRPAPRSRVPSPATSTWTLSSSTVSSPESVPSVQSSAHTTWWPVPSDETHRIGASGLLTVSTSNQGVPDFSPDLLDILPNEGTIKFNGSKSKPPPHGEKIFFGLAGGQKTSAEIEEKWVNEGGAFAMSRLGLGDTGSKIKEEKWTKIEPFRFSVEFWDVDKLSEKERFYSTTHFYAGSFFNCYVQMIKRKEKGVQLGIYLHRQSPNEPFPIPSSPKSDSDGPEGQSSNQSSSLAVPTAGASHGRSMSTSPVLPGSPPALSTSLGGTRGIARSQTDTVRGGGPVDAEAPYHDTRAVTKAFFSISCASALGTALIRFTSGPDSFAHSQSWGWKSSALKSEEYLSIPPSSEGKETLEDGVMGWSGEMSPDSVRQGGCSLRATVVVGVV